MHDVPFITTDETIDRYAALLLDAYGVLVSLDGALPGAVAFIQRLNQLSKPYWLVSNTAARLPVHASSRYRRFGLDIPPERILTSGGLLAGYFKSHGLLGARVCVLGPDDSLQHVLHAGGDVVAAEDDFDVLVLADQAGFPMMETLDTVLSTLFDRFDAGQPVQMILPNPDLVYPTGKGWGMTAGSLALLIEAALAQRYPQRNDVAFARLGKPHAALFEAAAKAAGTRDLVMIGDQLETDIRGAVDFSIDSILVLGGVAGQQPDIHASRLRPTWLMRSLVD